MGDTTRVTVLPTLSGQELVDFFEGFTYTPPERVIVTQVEFPAPRGGYRPHTEHDYD